MTLMHLAADIPSTGGAAEVTPVGEIDGQTFTAGEITQELMTAYSDLVRSHEKASASASAA